MNMVWVRLAIILVAICLTGCGSLFTPDPVGIGGDRDALKQSPCVCDEIPQDFAAWHRAG
jgi:hypothetical protein